MRHLHAQNCNKRESSKLATIFTSIYRVKVEQNSTKHTNYSHQAYLSSSGSIIIFKWVTL